MLRLNARVSQISIFFLAGLAKVSVAARDPLPPPIPSRNESPFIAYDVGVGGNQHYSVTARRFFTNVVAVTTGDLDGDDNQDIVLLANAIPPNGAYSAAAPSLYNFSHYNYGTGRTSPGGTLWNGPFLEPGDMLFNAAALLGGASFNSVNIPTTWFADALKAPVGVHPYLKGTARTSVVHYAPPSPNIVAGLISTPPYVGSDLAWLQGDGRGNFTFRFITPGGAPARIRAGRMIRLEKLANTAVPGRDIVIGSGNANFSDSYQPQDSTSIELFSGESRVAWLENTGFVGNQLTFADHGIAEYIYDRRPWIFYGGNQNMSGGWVGPYANLSPNGITITPINADGRPDILVANERGGIGISDVLYNENNPTRDNLILWYSNSLPRPHVGERWIQNEQLWPGSPLGNPPTRLFWYENTINGGNTFFSTSTFHHAFLGMIGTPFTVTSEQLVPMRLPGGVQAFVALQPGTGNIGTSPSSPVYLRVAGVTNEMLLTTAPTAFPPLLNFKYGKAFAADIDGDTFDEMIVVPFTCDGGCTDKIRVYSVVPTGAVDVAIHLRYTFSLDTKWNEMSSMEIADMNLDGKNDIWVTNSMGNVNYRGLLAATILINTTPTGGSISFTPVAQRKPLIPYEHWIAENYYAQDGQGISALNPPSSVAFADFNGDEFNDFVRVGPNFPVTVFINNFNGLQRSRITTTVEHVTGTNKTWTSIWGAQTDGAVTIPAVGNPVTGAGGIGTQAVQPQ